LVRREWGEGVGGELGGEDGGEGVGGEGHCEWFRGFERGRELSEWGMVVWRNDE